MLLKRIGFLNFIQPNRFVLFLILKLLTLIEQQDSF